MFHDSLQDLHSATLRCLARPLLTDATAATDAFSAGSRAGMRHGSDILRYCAMDRARVSQQSAAHNVVSSAVVQRAPLQHRMHTATPLQLDILASQSRQRPEPRIITDSPKRGLWLVLAAGLI